MVASHSAIPPPPVPAAVHAVIVQLKMLVLMAWKAPPLPPAEHRVTTGQLAMSATFATAPPLPLAWQLVNLQPVTVPNTSEALVVPKIAPPFPVAVQVVNLH